MARKRTRTASAQPAAEAAAPTLDEMVEVAAEREEAAEAPSEAPEAEIEAPEAVEETVESSPEPVAAEEPAPEPEAPAPASTEGLKAIDEERTKEIQQKALETLRSNSDAAFSAKAQEKAEIAKMIEDAGVEHTRGREIAARLMLQARRRNV